MPSTVVAKNFDIRSDNFSTSSSVVTLKSYDDTTNYSFIFPASDPRYINGVSDPEQIADQVLCCVEDQLHTKPVGYEYLGQWRNWDVEDRR